MFEKKHSSISLFEVMERISEWTKLALSTFKLYIL